MTEENQELFGAKEAERLAAESEKSSLEWKMMPLAEMNPAPYNPREMTDEESAGLEGSLDEFGVVENLVWNKRSGFLVSGHKRREKMLKSGIAEAMTCVVDLNDEREKALNLTLNNPAIRGQWTVDKLRQMLEDQKLADKSGRYSKLRFDAIEKALPLFEKSPEFDAGGANLPLPDGAKVEGDPAAATNIKMVQLFLTTETQPLFLKHVQKLAPIMGVETVTECVFTIVRMAYERVMEGEGGAEPTTTAAPTGGTVEVETEVAPSTTQ